MNEAEVKTGREIVKYLEELYASGFLGMAVLVFRKGGDGPERIACDLFLDVDKIQNFPEKLRRLAQAIEDGEI